MPQSPDPAVPPAAPHPAEPPHPGPAAPAPAPQYPGAAPPYPDATAPPSPGAAPRYPGTAAAPEYPATPLPPTSPTSPPYPAEPTGAPTRPDTGATAHATPSAPPAAPPYPAQPAPPPYPAEPTGAPAYPGPGATTHPEPPTPPPYPAEPTGAPAYPGPGATGHPTSPAPPPYPDQPAPPPYPAEPTGASAHPGTGAADHPVSPPPSTPPPYPAEPAPPPYPPQPAVTSAYPGPGTTAHPASPAPPPYPVQPAGAPAYPGAGAAAHPAPAAPPYPQGAVPPFLPGGGVAAPPPHPGVPSQTVPPTPGSPGAPPEPAPDDLDYRHRGARVLVAEHQRGADATAIGRLAVQIPGFLVSLAVVSSFALGICGHVVGTVVVLAWLASGALVFHRPTELAFARHVLKLRVPTADERARLEPVWREVTARAGIEAHTYELMVENSDGLNAVAVAGHVVGVTTYALNRIPSGNLAAVLAHELGHHTAGHAWAGLLGYWYSLPGRIAWAVTRGLARVAIAVAGVFSLAAAGIVYLVLGFTAIAGFVVAWYITIPLVAAPYLLAYVGRRGELRADQQAAELGFAHRLAEVIHHSRLEEESAKAAALARGQKLKQPGPLARLLSSHPDHDARLAALEPYLRLRR